MMKLAGRRFTTAATATAAAWCPSSIANPFGSCNGAFSHTQQRLQAARALNGTLGSDSSSSVAAAAAAGTSRAASGSSGSPLTDGDGGKAPTPRNATTMLAGPYRRVGNVFIVTCEDHPFKHGWEVNRMLRDLRLEFKGQTTIHPDIPEVRKRLWRVRHIVRLDILDLDEAKELVGVPAHVTFSELNAQIPATFGRGGSTSSPVIRSKVRFMRLRRMRLRDVLHRDEIEKRLLEEKRRALAATSGSAQQPQER